MSDEVGTAAEGFGAVGAEVGLLTGVGTLVLHQAGALAEAFVTLGALEGLLAAVQAAVLAEVGAPAEAFAAGAALVGFLSSVGALVLEQVGVLGEALGAGTALVGLLARVGAQVPHQVRALPKSLTALRALVGLPSARRGCGGQLPGPVHLQGWWRQWGCLQAVHLRGLHGALAVAGRCVPIPIPLCKRLIRLLHGLHWGVQSWMWGVSRSIVPHGYVSRALVAAP